MAGEQLEHDLDLPLLGAGLADAARRFEHAAQRRDFDLHVLVVFALLDLRQAEQVFDDRVQAVGLLGDDLQEAVGVSRLLDRAVEQRFDEAFDRSDRRLQLVRDVGHEVAADAFEPAKVGHVVSTTTAPMARPWASCSGRAARLHHALPIAVQQDVGLDGIGTTKRAADEAAQIGVAHHFVQRATLCLGLVETEQPARSGVEADQPFAAVDGQHPFGHAGQHGLLLVVVLHQDGRSGAAGCRPSG